MINKSLFFIKYNICCADLADMQLTSKCKKVIRFLLCVIDTFSKYDWVFPLKDKKFVTIAIAFRKVLNKEDSQTISQRDRKPKKICPHRGSEFYKSAFKKWSKHSDIKCIQHTIK